MSPSTAERADRALAQRLQREEEERLASIRVTNKRKAGPAASFVARSDGVKKRKTERCETLEADRLLAQRLQEEERLESMQFNLTARATVKPVITQQQKEVQSLRQEQDMEYEKALLADQIRDIERNDAEERERRKEYEKDEMEEWDVARRASAMDNFRTVAASAEEPPANAKDVTRLRFALPDGKKVDRRFLSEDTIHTVRAFLLVHFHDRNVHIRNVGLVSNYPKREFDEENDALTLEEAGLAPQAMVMVRDLDA
jgi:hypothetical protein